MLGQYGVRTGIDLIGFDIKLPRYLLRTRSQPLLDFYIFSKLPH